jgi:hypothetical protein
LELLLKSGIAVVFLKGAEMTFEQANKTDLKTRLQSLGWRQTDKWNPNIAGQLHSWHIPPKTRGQVPHFCTMRIAAKRAGLISG